MKFKITILACFFAFITQGQTFQDFIVNGDKFYSQGKFIESAREYDKAFELNNGDEVHYYNAACSWALSGDTIQSIKYLNLAIDYGWKDINSLRKDKDLSNLHSSKNWSNILNRLQTAIDEYEKHFDKPLKEQLEYLYIRDQTLRVLIPTVQKKFGRDSKQMKYFWKVLSEQDSLNLLEVKEIIEERGWVGKSQVGNEANQALWYVIQHAELGDQEKYLPLLKESVIKGESSAKDMALLEDRINVHKGIPQIYGSQMTFNKKTGKWQFPEIYKPEYVNQRRKEVGLYPIEDDVKRLGIKWSVEQKER